MSGSRRERAIHICIFYMHRTSYIEHSHRMVVKWLIFTIFILEILLFHRDIYS